MCSNSPTGGKSGGGGSNKGNSKKDFIQRIEEPKTKSDYVDRLQVIANMGQPTYNVEVNVNDWQNYGKDRTYLKIKAYRESDGKLHHEQDYGYIDNNTGKYYPKNKYNDLSSNNIFTMSGAKPSEKQLNEAVEKIIKKKKSK